MTTFGNIGSRSGIGQHFHPSMVRGPGKRHNCSWGVGSYNNPAHEQCDCRNGKESLLSPIT